MKTPDQKNIRSRRHRIVRVILRILGSLLAVCLVAFLICFPGSQAPIAFTLATGLGVSNLQTRIDRLEDKATKGMPLSETEKRFLLDLYTCFAKGGTISRVTPQSGKMMRRYLSGTGETLAVSSGLFTRSAPVRRAIVEITKQIRTDLEQGGKLKDIYSSETFYMGDPKYFDSFVGLYFGKLTVHPGDLRNDSVVLHWRAEVPWNWPSYESLFQKYGDYHAQSFPLPNARSLIQGVKYCLHMDDGLGGYLATIGLAKPFLAYSEWDEALMPIKQSLPPSAHTN